MKESLWSECGGCGKVCWVVGWCGKRYEKRCGYRDERVCGVGEKKCGGRCGGRCQVSVGCEEVLREMWGSVGTVGKH